MAAAKDKKGKSSKKSKTPPKKTAAPSKSAKSAKAPAKASASKSPAVVAVVEKVTKGKAAPKPVVLSAAAKHAAAVINAKGKDAKGKAQLRRTSRSVERAMNHATGAEAYNICREIACESSATSAGYCRLHYIKNWKKIKRKELILKEGKLNQYIEELVAKYPDKYIEAIKQDLSSDKEFGKVVHDLELTEGIDDFDVDGENVDALVEGIKREYDDEGDAY